MIDNASFAEQANSEKYTGVSYDELDCQAFVEKVLKDTGTRKADGSAYNWKGSNSMWRNALSWKGTIAECLKKFDCIPLGAWVFIVSQDGGEKEKGYNDKEGNAKHVGIYCRSGVTPVRDSTRNNLSGSKYRNGVGYRSIDAFTHVGLPFMIDFKNMLIPERVESLLIDKKTALEYLDKVKQYIERG